MRRKGAFQACEKLSVFASTHTSKMWPFFLDRTVTIRRRVHGPMSKVCEIIQDAESFSKLQPLVTKVEQDPSNTQRYKITEHLHAPARLWEYDNSFHAVFIPKEDEEG